MRIWLVYNIIIALYNFNLVPYVSFNKEDCKRSSYVDIGKLSTLVTIGNIVVFASAAATHK